MAQAALALSQQHPAIALMARETRVREGAVPRELAGAAVPDDRWSLHGEEFLFRTVEGIGLHYRRGAGITLERPPGTDPRTIALWLNGTLYAAIAAVNGLYPLHASAVAHGGRVFAFTGATGAGKSTLVAALGRAGFAQFCDDTLILDIAGEGPPLCLPGHKRLMLCLEDPLAGRTIDWNTLREEAERGGWARGADLLLALTGRWFGPLPAPLLQPPPPAVLAAAEAALLIDPAARGQAEALSDFAAARSPAALARSLRRRLTPDRQVVAQEGGGRTLWAFWPVWAARRIVRALGRLRRPGAAKRSPLRRRGDALGPSLNRQFRRHSAPEPHLARRRRGTTRA